LISGRVTMGDMDLALVADLAIDLARCASACCPS
jgi:hypothetical protein